MSSTSVADVTPLVTRDSRVTHASVTHGVTHVSRSPCHALVTESRPVPSRPFMWSPIHEPSPSARAGFNEHLTARGGRPWMNNSNEEVTRCP